MNKIKHINHWLGEAVSDIEFLHKMSSGNKLINSNIKLTKETVDYTIHKKFPFIGEIRPEFRGLFLKSLRQGQPVLWFLLYVEAGKMVRQAVLDLAGVEFEKLIGGQLKSEELSRITIAAGELSRLGIRIFCVEESCQFEYAIETLAALDASCCAVCDWVLEDEEIAKAEAMVSGSKLTLLLMSVAEQSKYEPTDGRVA